MMRLHKSSKLLYDRRPCFQETLLVVSCSSFGVHDSSFLAGRGWVSATRSSWIIQSRELTCDSDFKVGEWQLTGGEVVQVAEMIFEKSCRCSQSGTFLRMLESWESRSSGNKFEPCYNRPCKFIARTSWPNTACVIILVTNLY